jgi:hypothetical protein
MIYRLSREDRIRTCASSPKPSGHTHFYFHELHKIYCINGVGICNVFFASSSLFTIQLNSTPSEIAFLRTV